MNATIHEGDALEVLRSLEGSSVRCCVTSPPYWGLRDYGTAEWSGGDEDCEHVGKVLRTAPAGTTKQTSNHGAVNVRSGDCACGAVRVDSQVGLEETPEQYVERLVDVFREVRRVLVDDGTLWINIGDSYANTGFRGSPSTNGGFTGERMREGKKGIMDSRPREIPPGLKPKDLVGIPWRVAFALQADGWFLRSDIIWSKSNPMPESVIDRPTKSHEYLFLLSKRGRYKYNAAAIAEPVSREFWNESVGPEYMTELDGRKDGGKRKGAGPMDGSRNKRSVWTVATRPYKEAHFATYPPALIEPCILAGTDVDDIVLDPFCGSGTTGEVALRNNRNFVGIELNPSYVELSVRRLESVAPLFAKVDASFLVERSGS